MKKIIIITLLAITAYLPASAFGSDRAITIDQLPQKAQAFIGKYFAQNKVAYAKQDTDLFDGSYTVGFTDGSKVEFSSKGAWKDLECPKTGVHRDLIPDAIYNYVNQNYPDTKIIEIEFDREGWDLELSNRTSLEFDKKFRLIDLDRD